MTEALLFDSAFWFYFLTSLVSLLGLSLFIWWWKKVGTASEIYFYFTLLMASESFRSAVNAYARYCRFNDNDISDYLAVMVHPIWNLRALIHLIILFVIVLRMVQRTISTMAKVKRFKLEEDNVQDPNRG